MLVPLLVCTLSDQVPIYGARFYYDIICAPHKGAPFIDIRALRHHPYLTHYSDDVVEKLPPITAIPHVNLHHGTGNIVRFTARSSRR